MLIYKVTDKTNNKVYIGQTINSLEKRRRDHENAWSSKRCTLFDKMIHEIGKDNFHWEIIEDNITNLQELSNREIFWIKEHDSLYKNGEGNGHNLSTGGTNGWVHDESTIEILKKVNLGENNHMYGIRAENGMSKKVICTTTGKYYDNATLAAENEMCNPFKVYCVCRGERQVTGNKVFRYVDNDGQIKDDFFTDNIFYNLTTSKRYYFAKELRSIYPKEIYLRTFSEKLKEIQDKDNEFIIWNNELWAYNNSLKFNKENLVGKNSSNGKIILNKTLNEVSFSMNQAALSIGKKSTSGRNLGNSIRKGNGKCIWNKYEWEII